MSVQPDKLPAFSVYKRQFSEKVHKRVDQVSTRISRKQFNLWDSSAYFKYYLHSQNQIQSVQRLKLDLTTFFHEYVGMFWKKIYPYSKFGIFDGYDIPMSHLGKNFENLLENQGKCTIRASLETLGMQTFEEWADDELVPEGEALLFVSPRGSLLKENYPGFDKENYVFINIFQKIGPNQHQLIQYTSFDSEEALEHFQFELLQSHPEFSLLADLSQEKHNSLSLPHAIIARKIKIKAGFSIQDIEEIIYKNEASWPTKRKELPQIDESQFGLELHRLLLFCEAVFVMLADSNPHQISDDTTPFLKKVSEFHHEIDSSILPPTKQFDLLVECSRKEFLKWVQDHAINYRSEEINVTPISISRIIELWGHECLNATKQLAKNQKSSLTALQDSVALSPLFPLMRLSSLAHCISFTPHSVALQLVKFPASNFDLAFTTQISDLSSLEKSKAFSELSQKYVQIHLFGQRWYIAREQSHEYTERSCRIINGKILGPCGVPLEEDSEFCLSGETFDQLFLALNIQTTPSKFDAIQSKFNNSHLSLEEKNRTAQFMIFLETLIRKTAGLIELINNDLYLPLAHQVIALIEDLPDPLKIIKSPHLFAQKIATLLENLDISLLPLFLSQELRATPTAKKTV
ncbi:MAG: hypothetical protein WAU07_01025 [Microgenomates group bacterium]